jgi:MarC family membrane protein
MVVFALVTLLPIINPPGAAPIFLSMTRGASDTLRATLAARRVARNSFVLLAAAMLVGSYVLIFFGLSLAVVKIAGGLLVTATAWHLIRAEQSYDSTIVATPPAAALEQIAGHSFYPLTFPLTIGPGSLSVAVAAASRPRGHWHSGAAPAVCVHSSRRGREDPLRWPGRAIPAVIDLGQSLDRILHEIRHYDSHSAHQVRPVGVESRHRLLHGCNDRDAGRVFLRAR